MNKAGTWRSLAVAGALVATVAACSSSAPADADAVRAKLAAAGLCAKIHQLSGGGILPDDSHYASKVTKTFSCYDASGREVAGLANFDTQADRDAAAKEQAPQAGDLFTGSQDGTWLITIKHAHADAVKKSLQGEITQAKS